MKKYLSILKKHKKKIIILSAVFIIVVAIIISVMQIIKYFTPDVKESVYGDRCEITESLIITKEKKDELKEVVAEHEGMELASINVKCNLIDMIVIVDDEIAPSKVRTMSKSIITTFSEEQLRFYDLQLFVDSDNKESETYPLIGTRAKQMNGETKNNFVW